MSFRVEDELADEARGAVAQLQRARPDYSRDALLRRGLELVLLELRELHNRGRRFAPARGPLRRGRPRGT